MRINIEFSDKIKRLPPYLFVEIDRAKNEARQEGRDIIDLGVGDPDRPTPKFVVEALRKAVLDPETHRYALERGSQELRLQIAKWFKSRFNVELDPDSEILPLIGSKEGIAHIPVAFINHADLVLVPDPCYPPYISGTIFAGGEIISMPLLEKNRFLPDLKSINHHLLKRVKMAFINYPNNPTATVCDKRFFKHMIEFCSKHNIIICNDAAYSEIAFDDYKVSSILELDGAKDVAIEFHSLSKTFNMTGWRIGFACGNRRLIEGLAKVKSNIDSGIFMAIQKAACLALQNYDRCIGTIKKVYQERRDIFVDGLNSIGWKVDKPLATFYVWAKVIDRFTSVTLARALLEKADVVATPGNGFGAHGEGYIRVALTVDKARLQEAIDRIKKRLL